MEKILKTLIFLLILSSFWLFWIPGTRVATDFHLTEKTTFYDNLFPWSWRETAVADGLGEYTVPSLWAQPLQTLVGFLSGVVPLELLTKILGFAILLIGFFGIWRLLDEFKIGLPGKAVGGFFFLTNSAFLLLFDGGQFSLALAYSALPFAFLYFLRCLETSSLYAKLKFAIWVLIISIFDIRIVYLLMIISLMYLLFLLLFRKDKLESLSDIIYLGIITTLLLAGFHSFWLLPAFLAKSIQLPQTYGRASQVDFLSFSSLGHAILLQQPHWYTNVFGRISSLRAEFILVPLLVLLAPLLKKRSFTVAFFLIMAVIGLFLVKGSQPPLSGVYGFLFTHIPGFSLFRDPSKFFFLLVLSYSVLMAISVDKLAKNKFNLLPILILFYLIWLIRPVYLGQMTGMFSTPLYKMEFSQLKDLLKDDNNFGRVFWIPNESPLGFIDKTHPGVEASRLVQKRPFAIGTIGNYETFNFLREASFMDQIFDVAGISYIAYPYLDPRRDDMHPDHVKYYYTFLDQLSKRPWLTRIENSSIPLLKTAEHQNRFFIASNIWWVIGSDSIYNDSTKSAGLKLAKNALIFAEEYPGLGKKIAELPEAKLILNRKTSLDLAVSFFDPLHFIFPARGLDFQPDKSGWWKREAVDLVWWRSFLQGKYGIDNQDFDLGGGWAIGEGDKHLIVLDKRLVAGKVLLARVMESSRSGELKFYQGDHKIGAITTKIKGDANVRWFEVGRIADNNTITIQSEGDINVVNALAVLDDQELLGYQKTAKDYESQGRIVDFSENSVKALSPEVKYQQINPTKYKVSIKGLTTPAFLIFSENFDGLWKINGEQSLPVYSLLNGFRVSRDGDYLVEFEPQKYVYPGLAISVVTLIFLILLLVKSKTKGLKI